MWGFPVMVQHWLILIFHASVDFLSGFLTHTWPEVAFTTKVPTIVNIQPAVWEVEELHKFTKITIENVKFSLVLSVLFLAVSKKIRAQNQFPYTRFLLGLSWSRGTNQCACSFYHFVVPNPFQKEPTRFYIFTMCKSFDLYIIHVRKMRVTVTYTSLDSAYTWVGFEPFPFCTT